MGGCCAPGVWLDRVMQQWGVAARPRRITLHYCRMLGEQAGAMLPLSLLQICVLGVFFKQVPANPGVAVAGLLCATAGLVLFLDSLRLSIMPMAMQVGQHLPHKMPLPVVVLVAFCLGVLVTYAEPAIAAIRPLAALVNPETAPLLYFVLNQKQELTVLSIGLGVGLAAVLGMLKFMYNLPLKALIAGSLVPTLAAACWMQWGNPHLQPLLGMAWDCGAVTTGPVTVPILIALGVSVMKAQREKEQALAVLEEAVDNEASAMLDGFGIVTLASLLPILAVEVMGIVISLTHPYDQVLAEVSRAAAEASSSTEPLVNRSPVREVIFAVRAIVPLCAALLLLLLVVLRVPLPVSHFDTAHPDHTAAQHEGGAVAEEAEEEEQETEADSSCSSEDNQQQHDHHKHSHQQHQKQGAGAMCDTASGAAQPAADSSSQAGVQQQAGSAGGAASKQQHEIVVAGAGKSGKQASSSKAGSGGAAAAGSCCCSSHRSRPSRRSRCCGWLSQHAALLWGMLMCLIGMMLFNLGLTYGFTALGDLTGTYLPTSFMQLPYAPGSPYYSVAGGVILTMVTVFLLGVLATNAEPALNVLGQTVETMSAGQFSKRMLVWAVSVGVAVGMDAGACKILFSLPLIYFILAKYAVAGVLTAFTKEEFSAIAWDSAGVTTGPVTVPFVLAIGLAFGRAVGAAEGFGMLTVMSVAPIVSVLITGLLRKPVQKVTAELIRVSTSLAKYSLERISRPSRYGLSTLPSLSARSQGFGQRGGDASTSSSASFGGGGDGMRDMRRISSLPRTGSGVAGMRSLACRSAPPVRIPEAVAPSRSPEQQTQQS